MERRAVTRARYRTRVLRAILRGDATETPMTPRTCGLLAALFALSACASGEQGFGNTEQNSNVDEGNGTLEVSPTELVIEDVLWEDGVAGSGTITVTSVGDGTLRLYDVALSDTGGGALYMVPVDEDINLATGVSRDFVINATLTEYAKVEGSLRIQSNDGEQQLIEVPITALPTGWEEPEDSGDAGDSGR